MKMEKHNTEYTAQYTREYMAKREANALRFKAYEAIKEKLICLELKPGEKIFENELAKTLNVSRTPVREALLMLEHEKLVSCSDSLGFVVRRFTAKDVEEYFAVRHVIEQFVISLVVKQITEDEILILKNHIREAEKIIREGNIHRIVRCETEFHNILYKTAKSDVLLETISRLVDKFQLLRALSLSVPGSAANSLAEHKKILDAIEKRDAKRLKRLMRLHLDESKRTVAGLMGLLL
jgi:DNA-binding GntR family transcriptional regulator